MDKSNCDLCLCCGAPWPPVRNDSLDMNTALGNMCVNHLNKLFSNNEEMRAKYKHPAFSSKAADAHVCLDRPPLEIHEC